MKAFLLSTCLLLPLLSLGTSGIPRQPDSAAPPTNSESPTNDTVAQQPSEEGAPTEEPDIGPALDSNGRQCPSCFSDNMEDCENGETVRCYGDETQCIDLFGAINTHAGKHYIRFQGCATPEQCDMTEERREPVSTMSDFMPIQVECSDAQPSSDQPNIEG